MHACLPRNRFAADHAPPAEVWSFRLGHHKILTTLFRSADRQTPVCATLSPHNTRILSQTILLPLLPLLACITCNCLWLPAGQWLPREVLSEVFLSTPPSSSATSALFVGWGLLLGYDLCLNEDNASEPLNIDCNNVPLVDVWCPLGSRSESISFNRSRGEIDTERGGTRSPINYATAYVDLDWLYGRDEDSATALRTLESGYLNLTAEELPHLLPDGTWLVSVAQACLRVWGTWERAGRGCTLSSKSRAGAMQTETKQAVIDCTADG